MEQTILLLILNQIYQDINSTLNQKMKTDTVYLHILQILSYQPSFHIPPLLRSNCNAYICPNFILVLVPTIFNTSFHFLLTYFRYNHIIMIETGFLSSKILFAHRWRLISDRLENIVRSPEASNKCPARKFRPCRMAGLIL